MLYKAKKDGTEKVRILSPIGKDCGQDITE